MVCVCLSSVYYCLLPGEQNKVPMSCNHSNKSIKLEIKVFLIKYSWSSVKFGLDK